MMRYVREAWLVIALCLLFGAALAGVQAALQPKVEANKLADTLGQIPALVPGAVSGVAETIGGLRTFRALDAERREVGRVLVASGQGFADRIELLVGVDAAGERITGLYIVDQKETPGLGDFITKEKWRAQFAGKPARVPLRVTKSGATRPEQVDGVTGATISSEAVVSIVNTALAQWRKEAPGL
ncbi:MAG: FMN-binding protein [Kiritimatiellae bacterium]|nr:FMN-binding protein [Kiritimatiellia bacterium]MDW8457879.1 FMN-binding protein [Verrucomicrobiota bacterium]